MPRWMNRDHIEWGIFAFAITLGLVLSANFLIIERRTILEGEHERLKIQTVIAGNVLESQIGQIQRALAIIRTDWDDGLRSKSALNIATMQNTIPGLLDIVVAAPDGRILADGDSKHDGYLRDRASFADIAKLNSPDEIYIAPPRGAGPGTSTIRISIVNGASGNAARMFTAVVQMDYFDAVLHTIQAMGTVRTALEMNKSGVLLKDLPDAHMQPRRPMIDVIDDRAFLGVRRMIDCGKTSVGAPLTLRVMRQREIVERPWRRLAWACLLTMTALALAGAGLLRGLHKRRRRYDDESRQRAAEQAEYTERMALTLSTTALGLWDLALPSMELLLDERSARIQGGAALRRKVTRDTLMDSVHPDDLATLLCAIQSHVDGASGAFDCDYRIRHQDGSWVWVHSSGKVVARDRRGQPTRVLGTLMDIDRRKRDEREIKRLAYCDALTGLPNRALLMARLQRSLQHCSEDCAAGALLFIDLDNFKSVNDTLGHAHGDKLLQQVAERLTRLMQDVGTVSRHGGDEFIVLLDSAGATPADARRAVAALGSAILERLGQVYRLDGHDVYSTPSIGAAIFDAASAGVDDVLKHADMAMYEAKAEGKNTIAFFDPAMQRKLDHEAALENDMRHAALHHRFELHYQTIHDGEGAPVGVEALVRWPIAGGYRSPAEFIPLAEKSGLIIQIGQQVLDMACGQIAAWRSCEGGVVLPVSVNVSACQFRQAEFVAQVHATLQRFRVPPGSLKLEITEGVFVSDAKDVIDKMNALRALGVALALDDFGTGYSSLSYLRNLPLGQLKIDRSFIVGIPGDPRDRAIVKSIIDLATHLGLDVVAEGVETEAQFALLKEHGCRHFQGFYFSRPIPAALFGGTGNAASSTV